jgi:deoxyribonuclease-4
VDEGIARVAAALDEAINRAEADTMVLIENTAGQGTGLGRRFEELAMIREQAATAASIGVCLDTCHVFAAGYDIRGEQSYSRTMAEFDRIVGCEHLRFFHLNDSKKELGSRVDRHEHIGHGALGLEGFAPLLNDPRFASHAMAIETPKGEELREDRETWPVCAACCAHNDILTLRKYPLPCTIVQPPLNLVRAHEISLQ